MVHTWAVGAEETQVTTIEKRFGYDALNRMTNMVVLPSGFAENWQYDAVGNETNHWTSSGFREIKTYDPAGRVIRLQRFGPPNIEGLPRRIQVAEGEKVSLPVRLSHPFLSVSNLLFHARILDGQLIPNSCRVTGPNADIWTLSITRPSGLVGTMRVLVIASDGFIASTNLLAVGPSSLSEWTIGPKPLPNPRVPQPLKDLDGTPLSAFPQIPQQPPLRRP